MLNKSRSTVIIVFVLSLFLTSLAGAVPNEMNYQGKVTGAGGILLDGNYDMKFSLYNDPDDGNRLWNEEQIGVPITDGVFNVSLGAVVPLSETIFTASFLGLEVEIYNPVRAIYEILSPRQRLISTAYAFQAENAQTIGGYGSAYFAPVGHEHSGEDTTSGTVDEARIDPDIARDTEITWANLLNIPSDIQDGDDGITIETDPTITEPSIKDGVSWGEIGGIPAGFSDGVDNEGIATEVDPQVGTNTANYIPVWNGLYNELRSGSIYNNYITTQAFPPEGEWRVGIGTQAPLQKLEVGNGNILIRGADNFSAVDEEAIVFLGDEYNYIKAKNGTGLIMGSFEAEDALTIKQYTGNIGIGTTDPGTKLHIVGNNPRILIEANTFNPELNFKNSGDLGSEVWALYKDSNTHDFNFYQSGNKMTIQNSTGNVGIGTSNPEFKLHVNGLSKFQVGGGSINMSTPGGNPGIIAFSDNGHRRDITYNEEGVSITVSGSSLSPSSINGIQIYENGHVAVKVLEIKGADLSEQYNVRDTYSSMLPIPGQVVSIDPENPGDLLVSHAAYDRKVAGIISGAGDISIGMLMGKEGHGPDGKNPVALTGRVYCLADASDGPIFPGDLLTTSNTPGHAMKVTDYPKAQGAILGKAMSGLETGKGLVLTLVSLQ